MGKIMWTTGTGIPHRSFEEEFLQGPIFFGGGVTAAPELLEGKGKARLPFAPNGHAGKGRMTLPMTCQEFTIDVEMDAVKPLCGTARTACCKWAYRGRRSAPTSTPSPT